MDQKLKQRLVGAAVLVSVAVIFIPMVLDSPAEPEEAMPAPTIPPRPEGGFTSRIVPLGEPETPLLDERAARTRERAARAAARLADAPAAPAREASAPAPTPTAAAPAPESEPAAAASAPAAADAQEGAAAPAGAWAVQLGSFSNEKNALALRDRLRAKGYAAFVESAYSDGGELTRVYVGPELERERAAAAIGALEKETKLKGIVVRYPGG